jgi:hypothetical protein
VPSPTAYISADWPEDAVQTLRQLDFGVQSGHDSATGASVLVVGSEPVDDGVLDRLLDLEIVCATPDTVARVDVGACTRRRIPVLCAAPQEVCNDLALISQGEAPRHCVNPVDVLPIIPPQQFAAMRASREFQEGDALRALA